MKARLLLLTLLLAGCEEAAKAPEPPGPNDCTGAGTEAATARCLQPTMPEAYYVEQALKYFDTLDVEASPDSLLHLANGEEPQDVLLRELHQLLSLAGDAAAPPRHQGGTHSPVVRSAC